MAQDLACAARAMSALGIVPLMAAPARTRFETAARQGHDRDEIAAVVDRRSVATGV